MNKYIAELFGTFTLVLVVMLSLAGKFPVPTPLLAATVLGTFVYTIGFISGSQINPAVTIGLWSVKKLTAREAVLYIIFQFAGTLLAMFVANVLVVATVPQMPPTTFVMGLAELIGTLLLTFGVANVIYGKINKELSGIVIGGSLFIGITAAAVMGSAGVINPAVSLGIGLFNPIYIVGQIIGGILGFWFFKFLAKQK
jgi:glycerol uptake facilitator-like aquaporin